MSFDPIGFKFPKSNVKISEGGAGYSAYEIASHISFNGDIIGKDDLPGDALGVDGTFVHVSDEVFTGGTAIEEAAVASGGFTYDMRNMRTDVSNDGIWMFFGEIDHNLLGGEKLYALSFGSNIAQLLGVSKGTYVWTYDLDGVFYYVSYINGYFIETVHTIDPKYLPPSSGGGLPVVDFDEIGLTDAILQLMNSGGGDLYLPSLDDVGKGISEAMCKSFPADGCYVAKLTVPGMGAMSVNPVYTLFDEYGFKAAHFDSYTENSAGLNKFYVRLYRNTSTANYDSGSISVGFYT